MGCTVTCGIPGTEEIGYGWPESRGRLFCSYRLKLFFGLGQTIPCKIDGNPKAVAVECALGGFLGDEPGKLRKVLALLVDAALRDPEDLCDPGRFDAALGVALPVFVEEAADEVPEDGGDERPPGAAGDKPDDASWDRHPSIGVGDEVETGFESL